jgi:hypothetical protein
MFNPFPFRTQISFSNPPVSSKFAPNWFWKTAFPCGFVRYVSLTHRNTYSLYEYLARFYVTSNGKRQTYS